MSDPSKTKNFDNRYDNGDLQLDRTSKDIASAYTEYDEMKCYKMYLETLEIEQRVADSGATINTIIFDATGKESKEPIALKDLVPRQSEFEQARRRIIAKLNKLPSAEMKRVMAEFETESMWELSSKITNFLLDKTRRQQVGDKFDLFKGATTTP